MKLAGVALVAIVPAMAFQAAPNQRSSATVLHGVRPGGLVELGKGKSRSSDYWDASNRAPSERVDLARVENGAYPHRTTNNAPGLLFTTDPQAPVDPGRYAHRTKNTAKGLLFDADPNSPVDCGRYRARIATKPPKYGIEYVDAPKSGVVEWVPPPPKKDDYSYLQQWTPPPPQNDNKEDLVPYVPPPPKQEDNRNLEMYVPPPPKPLYDSQNVQEWKPTYGYGTD